MSQIGTKMSQIPKYNFFGSSVPEGNFWCRNLFYNIWSRNYFVFQIGCFEKIRSNWMFRKIFSDLEISSKIFLSSKATVCLLTMHYCKAILTHLGHWVFIQHNSLTFFTVPWLKLPSSKLTSCKVRDPLCTYPKNRFLAYSCTKNLWLNSQQ